jgi:hypothetical protein
MMYDSTEQHTGSSEHEGRYMHAADPSPIDRDLFGNTPKRHRDWSHRRGEPRVLALLWMLYLMGATLVMFMQLNRSHTISYEIVRPAARMMLVLVVVGFSILWPLATGVLTRWPVPVVGGLTLMCAAWLLLLAGVLALAMRSISYNDTPTMRTVWMLVVVLIVVAAPIIGVSGAALPPTPVDQPRLGWLLSPITAVLELVRDRQALGVSGVVFSQQIRLLIAIGCVGLALLLIARGLEVAHARVRA